MRISELSRESGVPIATIKFYLREGLLPPGTRTARNQAVYDASHLRRLRLVRVLVEVGGLSLVAVRRVVEALADDSTPLPELLGAAHYALDAGPVTRGPQLEATTREVASWITARGWKVSEAAPAMTALAGALLALRQLGWSVGPEVFERYATHADDLAGDEIVYVANAPTREAALESTVVGTVVFERALVALRRLAQEHHSRARLHDY